MAVILGIDCDTILHSFDGSAGAIILPLVAPARFAMTGLGQLCGVLILEACPFALVSLIRT